MPSTNTKFFETNAITSTESIPSSGYTVKNNVTSWGAFECRIDSRSWKSCRFCRFNKCIASGMRPGIIRLDKSDDFTHDNLMMSKFIVSSIFFVKDGFLQKKKGSFDKTNERKTKRQIRIQRALQRSMMLKKVLLLDAKHVFQSVLFVQSCQMS